MSGSWKKLSVLVASVALLAAAELTGTLDVLHDPERIRDLLVAGGYGAWAVYLAVFTVLSAVGVPSVVFLVPMPLVWSIPISLTLGMIGSMTSSLAGFWVARYVARDWVASRLPARLERFDEKIEAHAFRTVVWIRLVFFLTPPATWFLALSRVPASTYAVGTFVGSLPGVLIFVVLGGSFFGWLAQRPPWVWATAGAVALGLVLARHLRAKHRDDGADGPTQSQR
jgi:uncharacterized membrane protein YdjX (TVP38/TMEM64 family)